MSELSDVIGYPRDFLCIGVFMSLGIVFIISFYFHRHDVGFFNVFCVYFSAILPPLLSLSLPLAADVVLLLFRLSIVAKYTSTHTHTVSAALRFSPLHSRRCRWHIQALSGIRHVCVCSNSVLTGV